MKKGKKIKKAFRVILTVAAVCALAAVLYLTYGALKDLGEGYRAMKNADLSGDFSGEISYDDHLYATAGYGVILDDTVADKVASMNAFLDDSLRAIDRRVFSAGLIYTMLIMALLVYPICVRKRNSRGDITVSLWIWTFLIYIFYLAAVFGLHKYFGLPFHIPGARTLVLLAVSFISVLGGNFALAFLISVVRPVWLKIIFGIAAVPAVFGLFLYGFMFEAGLYSEPYVESFDYVAEIDERLLDENFEGAYYDGEKNVLVVDGTEYPPETVENSEHFTGSKRTAAIIYEMLDPYSGNCLDLLRQETGISLSPSVCLLYVIKGFFWMLLGIRGFREE